MATIANLQILFSAKADSLTSTVHKSIASIKAYTNTVSAMKEARLNLTASTEQARAAFIQTKRLAQNLSRTPVGIMVRAKIDNAVGRVMDQVVRFKQSGVGIALAVKADKVGNWFAQTNTRVRDLAESTRIRMSAATNLAGIRMARMFEPVQRRATAASAWVSAKFGKLGLKGVMPFSGGDVLKSLGPFAKLAGSGIRVPVAFAAQGLTAGVGLVQRAFGPLAAAGSAAFGVIGSVAKVAGVGLAVAAGMTAYFVSKSLEAIDVNAKLSDRLGLSTEGLAGLQHAGNLAGVNVEMLTGGMEKMLKSLGGVADDGTDAKNVFTKLGLSVKDLVDQPADQAFSAIAEKIAAMTNASERATAVTQIFGKSGQSLLPLLMSGAEGIKAAQQEAEKLGLTYSRIDAAKVEQANDAMTRAGEVVTGVANQFAIGLSPYIEAAATKMMQLAVEGGGIGPKVGGALEWVAKAIATTADYTNLLPAAFYGFRSAATAVLSVVMDQIDTLGQGLVDLINLVPGMDLEWTDTFSTFRDGLEQQAIENAQMMNDAMDAFNRGDSSKSVTAIFDQLKSSAADAAQQTADKAEKMRGTFKGMAQDAAEGAANIAKAFTDAQDKVAQLQSGMDEKTFKLKQDGASADQIANFQSLQKRAKDLEDASALHDDMKSNADKLAERIEQINRMRIAAPDKVTDADVQRAIEKAKKEFNDGKDAPETASSKSLAGPLASIERRSSEGLVNAMAPTEAIAQKQLDETKKQTTSLSTIATSIGKASSLAVVTLDQMA